MVGLSLSDIRRSFTIKEIVITSKNKKTKEVLLKKNMAVLEIDLVLLNFLGVLPKVLFCLELFMEVSQELVP